MSDKDFQDHLDSRFDSLDNRLDRVELKLDDHLGRLSHAEASIEWLKGNAKLTVTIIMAAGGFLISLYSKGV